MELSLLVTAAEATTFVPRNSSPMTAVSLGTIIGKCSLNSPVLTNILLFAILSAGIFVVTPAVSAAVKIPIGVFTVGVMHQILLCNLGSITCA